MNPCTISVTIFASRKVTLGVAGGIVPRNFVGREIVTTDFLGAPRLEMTTTIADLDTDFVAAVAGIRKRFLEGKREAIRNHHRGQHGVQGTVAEIVYSGEAEPDGFKAAAAALSAFVADVPVVIRIVKPSAADFAERALDPTIYFGFGRRKTIYAVNDAPENREPPPLTDGKGTVG